MARKALWMSRCHSARVLHLSHGLVEPPASKPALLPRCKVACSKRGETLRGAG